MSNDTRHDTNGMKMAVIVDSPPAAKEPPIDTRATYLVLVLQGIGMLFPWNAIIVGESYFHNRFCDTEFVGTFENYFSVAYNLSSTFGLLMSIMFQHRFKPRTRVLVPMWITLIMIVLNTALVLLPPGTMAGTTLFGVAITIAIVMGFWNAVLQGGFFAIVGQMPFKYTQAILAGFAYAGFSVSCTSIITTWAGSSESSSDPCKTSYESLRWAAFSYFMVAVVVVGACLASFSWIEKRPIVIFYTKSDAAPATAETPLLVNHSSDSSAPTSSSPRLSTILKQTKVLTLAVAFNFCLTLCVFPSVTTHVRSSHTDSTSRFYKDLFIPFSFWVYNFGDVFGRTLAGIKQLIPNTPKGHQVLLGLVLLRAVFTPLFLFCNVFPSDGKTSTLTPFFVDDAWFMMFMFTFAVTSGYLGVHCMAYGPSLVAPSDQDTAGTIMVFALTAGLAIGAFVSFAWNPIIGA